MTHPLTVPLHVFHEDLFRDLPASTATDFAAIESRVFYAGHTPLFDGDQTAAALFVIHNGSVVLSHSGLGAGPAGSTTSFAGEILGLSATVAGEPYQASAWTLELSEIGLISRDDLLDFLNAHGDFAFGLVRILSDGLANALDHLRALPPAAEA
jgi:CRP-like cAMP-binding protein